MGSSRSLYAQTGSESKATESKEAEGSIAPLPPITTPAALHSALQGDPDSIYQALARVTPRGVSVETRKQLVTALIPQLDSEYPDIRGRTAETLALFGQDAVAAIPALVQRVGDPEPQMNLDAVWVSVSKALSAIGAPAIPALMQAIPNSDRATYYGITASISHMGEAARVTAPDFIELLRKGTENRRWATIFTLATMGEAAEAAIPDYIENLDHDNFNMKVIACRALAVHGPKAKAAVPKLLEMADKGLLSTRTHAAMCLASIGPDNGNDVNLVELFTKMAAEPNAFCQERGMIALGRLGTHASEAASFVEEMIAREDFSQKPEAARTLWQITNENQRPCEILKSLIDNPTYDLRVIQVLSEMGPAAAPLGSVLASKLDTDDQSLRVLLIDTFIGMGPAAKPWLPAIQDCLQDGSREVLMAVDRAVEVLGDK